MLSAELVQRITSEVSRYIKIANDHYKPAKPWLMPMIRFDLKGTPAGLACLQEWWVKYNPILCAENVERFMARTVPHEVAHLVDLSLQMSNGTFGRYGKRSVHGPSWKAVMRLFGVNDIKRCHTYDVTNVRTRTREIKRFQYVCKCGKTVNAGPKYHKLIQGGTLGGRSGRIKTRCCQMWLDPEHYKGMIIRGEQPAAVADSTPPSPPPAPFHSGEKTKADHAIWIVVTNMNTMSRQEMIATIMQECRMSKSGAQTYYYNAQKKLASKGIVARN